MIVIDTRAVVAIFRKEAGAARHALAKATDAPLMFKGADFGRTDLRSVL